MQRQRAAFRRRHRRAAQQVAGEGDGIGGRHALSCLSSVDQRVDVADDRDGCRRQPTMPSNAAYSISSIARNCHAEQRRRETPSASHERLAGVAQALRHRGRDEPDESGRTAERAKNSAPPPVGAIAVAAKSRLQRRGTPSAIADRDPVLPGAMRPSKPNRTGPETAFVGFVGAASAIGSALSPAAAR